MRNTTKPGAVGRYNGNPAFVQHMSRCCSNAEKWAAQSRANMAAGPNYSAGTASYRTSRGGTNGRSGGGTGVKSSSHKVIR
jgi:hypothetical protein